MWEHTAGIWPVDLVAFTTPTVLFVLATARWRYADSSHTAIEGRARIRQVLRGDNDTFGGPSAGDLVPGDLMTSRHSGDHLTLARAHGQFNVLGGLWPLVHMRSFEAVLGPKTDRWLVKTVAGLMIGNGWVQLRAASSGIGLEGARRIGLGTALTLGTVDMVYGLSGRISRVYFVDAVLEAGWIMAWSLPRRGPTPSAPARH